MRASCRAIPIAIAICAAAPAFADAQSQVQAARKAERRGEWKRALEAWKAAYAADFNAEYLIGIGDCSVKLGNTDEARKNYNAYLADPLALPANVEKVKAKVASLDSAGGALALPGGGLALPGPDAPASNSPPPLPLGSPPPLPGLDLPGSTPVAVAEEKGRKGKRTRGREAPPPLPGLDLPSLGAAPAAQVAERKQNAPPGLSLPGLELSGLPLAQPAPALPVKRDQSAVANNTPSPVTKTTGTQVAMTSPRERKPVPEAVIAQRPPPGAQFQASEGNSKTLAYVAAGVAVVGLGGGAFFFTQAGSAHSDLTGSVHDSATAQTLIDKESKSKTLSFIGLTAGLVSAGVAAALFAF